MNDIAVALSNTMDFVASLTTTTPAINLDSATAASATAVTTTPVTTTTATTTTMTTYTPSSDISIIARDSSAGTLSSESLSHLSREVFSYRPDGPLHAAVEIASGELSPQNQANVILKICDCLGDNTDAQNAQVASLSNLV